MQPAIKRISKAVAIPVATMLIVLSAGIAAADNVKNDVAISGVGQKRFITQGGSTTVGYVIERTGQVCDPASGSAATLTFNKPATVSVSPTSLTFTQCGVSQGATFSSSTVGEHTITVNIIDPGSSDSYNTSPATFVLVVSAANQTPEVSTAAHDANGTEGDLLTASGSFNDSNNDPLTITKLSGAGTVTDNGGGNWSWSLQTTDDANGSVTIHASDGNGGSATDTFQFTAANANPDATINNAPSTSPEGTEINLTSTISDPGPADTHSVQWAVTKNGGPYASGTGASFAFTPNDNGAYVVTATATDDDGGQGSDTKTIEATNVAPGGTLTASPATLSEGGTATVSFENASDSSSIDEGALRYAFACDGGSLAGTTYASVSSTASTTCSFDDGPTNVSVRGRVIDKDGGFSEYTTSIGVDSVAPVATFNAPSPVNEGSTFELSLTDPSDPSAADTNAGFAYAFDCGSGFGGPGGAGSATCSTTDDEVRSVGGTIIDKDGDSSSYSASVTVLNVAPTPTINGAPATSPEGTQISLTSSVTDPGSTDTHTYSWSVTKNGGPYASGSNQDIAFTPDDNGTYVVTLAVTDDDGGLGSDSESIVVTNVDPTATINGAPPANPEGTQVGLTSTVGDAGGADSHTYSWSVTKEGGAYGNGGTSPGFSFTPDDNATYVVTVTVTDDDGGQGSDSKTITVTNVDPSATFNAPENVNEGDFINLSLTDPADPSSVDEQVGFGYAFDCGSGFGAVTSSSQEVCATVDNGTVAVGGRIEDKDGGRSSYSRSVAVANVPPTIHDFTISGLPTGAACAANDVTVSFTVSDPAPESHDPITGTITWGDGSTTTISGRNVSETHSYAPGSYGLEVSVNDGDGGTDAEGATGGGPDNVNLFYATSGILQPINTTGTRSGFKIGSTIPVKIRIINCNGTLVSTLNPMVSLTKVDGTVDVPVNEVVSSSAADTGIYMRWSEDGPSYIYNLSTKRSQFCPALGPACNAGDLTQGTYRVTVSHPTIAPVSALLDLRK